MIDAGNMLVFIYEVLGQPFIYAAAFVGAFFLVLMLILLLIDMLDL